MILLGVGEITEKPNNLARVCMGVAEVARRGASRLFSYSSYYFILYISIGRDPCRPKAGQDNRKAISPLAKGWVSPMVAP